MSQSPRRRFPEARKPPWSAKWNAARIEPRAFATTSAEGACLALRVSVLLTRAEIADDNDIISPSSSDRGPRGGAVEEQDRNLQEKEARDQAREGPAAHLRSLLSANRIHCRVPHRSSGVNAPVALLLERSRSLVPIALCGGKVTWRFRLISYGQESVTVIFLLHIAPLRAAAIRGIQHENPAG